MNIYDIPVNFVVAAKNQEAADKARRTDPESFWRAYQKFGVEQ